MKKILIISCLLGLIYFCNASVENQVRYYLKDEGYSNAVENVDFTIRDDGQGVYIDIWNFPIAKPAMTNLPYEEVADAYYEDIREATPIVYDQPFEMPMISLISITGNVGVTIIGTDEGDIATFIVHSSPWPDKDSLNTMQKSAVTNREAIVTTLKSYKTDMTNNIAKAQAIDPSVFSGDQKTQIQNIRRILIDDTQLLNNMRKTLLRFYKVDEQ